MDERSCGETLMSTFDEDLFVKGLEQRKATLGADKTWLQQMNSLDPFKSQ